MRALVLVGLAACSSPPGTGAIVYSEAVTADIRLYDLETGSNTPIDSGTHGAISISEDGGHVA